MERLDLLHSVFGNLRSLRVRLQNASPLNTLLGGIIGRLIMLPDVMALSATMARQRIHKNTHVLQALLTAGLSCSHEHCCDLAGFRAAPYRQT